MDVQIPRYMIGTGTDTWNGIEPEVLQAENIREFENKLHKSRYGKKDSMRLAEILYMATMYINANQAPSIPPKINPKINTHNCLTAVEC